MPWSCWIAAIHSTFLGLRTGNVAFKQTNTHTLIQRRGRGRGGVIWITFLLVLFSFSTFLCLSGDWLIYYQIIPISRIKAIILLKGPFTYLVNLIILRQFISISYSLVSGFPANETFCEKMRKFLFVFRKMNEANFRISQKYFHETSWNYFLKILSLFIFR